MKTYYNLGQCIGERMVYFRSTDIEQKNWKRLLWSVPDELLFYLSKGEEIAIIDKSSNKGKIEHIFIPILNDLLNEMYFDEIPRMKNLKDHFKFAKDEFKKCKQLERKFKFWKDKIQYPLRLRGYTHKVKKEPNLLN